MDAQHLFPGLEREPSAPLEGGSGAGDARLVVPGPEAALSEDVEPFTQELLHQARPVAHRQPGPAGGVGVEEVEGVVDARTESGETPVEGLHGVRAQGLGHQLAAGGKTVERMAKVVTNDANSAGSKPSMSTTGAPTRMANSTL